MAFKLGTLKSQFYTAISAVTLLAGWSILTPTYAALDLRFYWQCHKPARHSSQRRESNHWHFYI
jgi:hypothetical protein